MTRGDAAPSLSVVIPSSGRWNVLRRTLVALARERRRLAAGPPGPAKPDGTAPAVEVIVVVDSTDVAVPDGLDADIVLVVPRGGPGSARNAGARSARGQLLLFLGDDIIPAPGLLGAHIAAHAADPDSRVAVLGRVVWDRTVRWRPVNAWLESSGTQFDYAQVAREDPSDIGFGRFYSANVSLTASLFGDAGGYDPRFTFAYEDLDLGWRLAQLGMRLRYAPDALGRHRHPYTSATAQRRFELVGEGERMMTAIHPWFAPWFRERFVRHVAAASAADPGAASRWAAWLHPWIPRRPRRVWGSVAAGADRHFHRRLADSFFAGWDRRLDREELEAYLGDAFSLPRLQRHASEVDEEAERVGDEQRFYRTSEAYLYDLTVFAMSGTKDPYLAALRRLVPPGSRVLDYGCGIGADGLRLIERGYAVEFADFDNPSTRYLRWRLERRGSSAPVHDLDAAVPGGFAAAFAWDVIEHVDDPFAFLHELEVRAGLVLVNLLMPVPGETVLHRELPISAIVRYARRRGLRLRRRLHGRSILIGYDGDLA